MNGLPRTEQRCTCEHLGHHHAGTIHAGACEVRGCTCIRFTWTDHAVHGDVALASIREGIERMDALELAVVSRAVDARRRAMHEARAQANVTAAWQAIERCKPGTKLHVHARGIVIGTLLRGDVVQVVRVDAERERLYVTVVQRRGKRVRPTKSGRTEGQIVFRPADVARYELKRERVDNPPTKADYDSAARIESSLNRMLDE